uniref:Organic solute transporter alpha-like protein n=1 Tax=Parascaris univalens TaxID=6257 RepID=A0A915AMJ0_PARUN
RFMFTVCTTYLMVCLFIVVALMRDLFGNRAALSEFLTNWEQNISLQSLPLCCCCSFLPNIESTEKNLRRVERLVLQSPVVRITLEILNIVLFLEQASYDTSKIMLEIIQNISCLLALYGCFILMQLGKVCIYRRHFSNTHYYWRLFLLSHVGNFFYNFNLIELNQIESD